MTRAIALGRGWRGGVAGVLSLALAWPAGAQDAALTSAPTLTPTPTPTAAVSASAPALGERGSLPAWTLAALPDEPVPFHGLVNTDNAGLGSGNMLYPTGGLGVLGLLVGVATHAALVGGSRSRQENRMQLAADKVLDPYRDALSRFRLRDLEQRALEATPSAALAHLHDAKEAPAGDVFVETAPAFAMTPDSAALVLDETVVVRPSPTSDKGVQQMLRVVSAPRPEADLKAAWSADDGAALKTTAAALMAQSLDLALLLSRHPADDKQAFRTLRYSFGDRERMERGQLLEETCDHLVIRTLRGALLVVPHKAGATLPDGCPAAPVVAERVSAPAESPATAASGVSASAALPAASAASGAGA
jgi:hypothetical protein